MSRSIKKGPYVQETLLKAWANRDKFDPSTNIKAWLFTILRNTYFSHLRKRHREVQDVDGAAAAGFVASAGTSIATCNDAPGIAGRSHLAAGGCLRRWD